jgi:hypothetical protein
VAARSSCCACRSASCFNLGSEEEIASASGSGSSLTGAIVRIEVASDDLAVAAGLEDLLPVTWYGKVAVCSARCKPSSRELLVLHEGEEVEVGLEDPGAVPRAAPQAVPGAVRLGHGGHRPRRRRGGSRAGAGRQRKRLTRGGGVSKIAS